MLRFYTAYTFTRSSYTYTRVRKIWTRSGQRGQERRPDSKRNEDEMATAIPDFHFNWTQRNIILNARNASEAPIKRPRRFALSLRTFVSIARPIVRGCPSIIHRGIQRVETTSARNSRIVHTNRRRLFVIAVCLLLRV